MKVVAYVIDLRADKTWIRTIEELKKLLLQSLGDKLLKIIALPSPKDRVYDSNLLIVVKDDRSNVVDSIIDSICKAEESMGLDGLISPLIVTENERRIIEGFLNYERDQ